MYLVFNTDVFAPADNEKFSIMKPSIAALFISLLLLTGCVTSQDRAAVNVGYYNVKGTSFEELDREIALHGPKVDGVGNAIAATRVRMLPDVRLGSRSGQCSVVRARISVIADVTLPRLSDRKRVNRKLQQAFTNIEEYARLHEAVHVDIAEKHAKLAERRILALPPQSNCNVLRRKIASTFRNVMAKHEQAQQAFDRREKRRFAAS